MNSLFKKVGILLLGLVLTCGAGSVQAQVKKGSQMFKIVVFGDSLSAGYQVPKNQSFAAQLQGRLFKTGLNNVIIVNHSRSGETTAGGLRRLPAVLEKENPNGLILELGINDVLRGLSVTEVQNNLSKMIELCQKKGVSVLLVGMKAPPYAGIMYQQRFDKMYSNLAKKYKLLLYPFFMKGLIEMENGAPQTKGNYMLGDNLHPNVQGISLMVQNIMPYISEFLKKNKINPPRWR